MRVTPLVRAYLEALRQWHVHVTHKRVTTFGDPRHRHCFQVGLGRHFVLGLGKVVFVVRRVVIHGKRLGIAHQSRRRHMHIQLTNADSHGLL